MVGLRCDRLCKFHLEQEGGELSVGNRFSSFLDAALAKESCNALTPFHISLDLHRRSMFGHRRCVEVRHTMSPFTKLRGSLFMSTRLIVDMYAIWNPPGVISEFPFGVAPPFVNRGRLPHLCRACCWFDLCFTSGSYLITGHACLYFASGTLQVSLHATWPQHHSF